MATVIKSYEHLVSEYPYIETGAFKMEHGNSYLRRHLAVSIYLADLADGTFCQICKHRQESPWGCSSQCATLGEMYGDGKDVEQYAKALYGMADSRAAFWERVTLEGSIVHMPTPDTLREQLFDLKKSDYFLK